MFVCLFATTLSTLSSELVSRTQTRVGVAGTRALSLEQLSSGWAGVWGRNGDLSRGARASLWTFHSPSLGGGDLPRGVRASLGTVYLSVSLLTTGWA